MKVTHPIKTELLIQAKLPMGKFDVKQYFADIGLSYHEGNSDAHFVAGYYDKRDKSALKRVLGEEVFKEMYNTIYPLHLSDSRGVPMYAVENGFYYLQIAHGTSKYHNAQPEDRKNYTNILARHLRISLDESKEIVQNLYGVKYEVAKERFINIVESYKPRWEKEAAEAIALLEKFKHLTQK